MKLMLIYHHRELGETMTDEELRAMIDEFDKDGDGESKFNFCFFPGHILDIRYTHCVQLFIIQFSINQK